MIKNSRLKKPFKLSAAQIILLGFASFILVGAFLLCLPISNTSHEWSSFVDALFTSTSSVCVTGLMVYDVAIELSVFGQVVVMILIQFGGLGFVAVASLLFLLIGKKMDYATRLTLQESLNKEDTEGVVRTVVFVLIATLVCEFVGFLMLAPSMIQFTGSFGSGLFKALFLSISAFCNAGFDPLGSSTPEFSNLMYFNNNPFVLIPVMLLIILGGLGFIVFIDVFNKTKKRKVLNLHTRVVLWISGILIFVGAGIFLTLEWNNPNTIGNLSAGNKIVNAFFQSVTTRTAGFCTFDQSQLTSVSQIFSGILMFIGGSPASMAGGIKTTTFFVLILVIFRNSDQNGNIIHKTKKISNNVILKAFRIVFIALFSILISSIFIIIFENNSISLSSVLFECCSAISTVGLSFGITPLLSIPSKLILSLLMYMGRIGMLTIPLAFKTKNQTAGIEYPEAKITVG